MFKRISILSIAVIFLLFTTIALAGTVQLLQTGQTKCFYFGDWAMMAVISSNISENFGGVELMTLPSCRCL